MGEPNVMVNFRLDRERPLRIRWLATDGVPGDGYKPQVTAIVLASGAKLAMDASAILESTAPDHTGGIGSYMMAFTGMVGFAADHPDRAHVAKLDDEEVGYELEFVHDTGRIAEEGPDYKIVDRPPATASRVQRGKTQA